MDEIFNFRFKQPDLKIDVGFDFQITENSNKYFTPKPDKGVDKKFIKFDNAIKMAREVILSKNKRYFCLLSGNFIFGDFIESFIMLKKLKVKNLYISTLSMSKENIDSLANLLIWGAVDNIYLAVSDFFYSHNKNTAIPYIYKTLDFDEQLDFCVSSNHTKITMIETYCGKKVVMHGSANLRSSSNIEQLMIEHDDDLFDFNKQWLDNLFQEYSTINKSLRRKKLWQTIIQE
jgi:hypothetical protein